MSNTIAGVLHWTCGRSTREPKFSTRCMYNALAMTTQWQVHSSHGVQTENTRRLGSCVFLRRKAKHWWHRTPYNIAVVIPPIRMAPKRLASGIFVWRIEDEVEHLDLKCSQEKESGEATTARLLPLDDSPGRRGAGRTPCEAQCTTSVMLCYSLARFVWSAAPPWDGSARPVSLGLKRCSETGKRSGSAL